jgi:hypothetical protein
MKNPAGLYRLRHAKLRTPVLCRLRQIAASCLTPPEYQRCRE